MFTRQKSQIDIKKSTQKLLDYKKDSGARIKHLKNILGMSPGYTIYYGNFVKCWLTGLRLNGLWIIPDTVDSEEAKCVFATHYSQIYHLVYEGVVSADAKIRGPGIVEMKSK